MDGRWEIHPKESISRDTATLKVVATGHDPTTNAAWEGAASVSGNTFPTLLYILEGYQRSTPIIIFV